MRSDIVLERARLGIEAEAFIRSNLGRYMLERAELEREQKTQELVALEPDDIQGNTRIRNDLRVVEMFTEWLDETVNSGKAAALQIEESEQPDF